LQSAFVTTGTLTYWQVSGRETPKQFFNIKILEGKLDLRKKNYNNLLDDKLPQPLVKHISSVEFVPR
jgi:hypothetical protein